MQRRLIGRRRPTLEPEGAEHVEVDGQPTPGNPAHPSACRVAAGLPLEGICGDEEVQVPEDVLDSVNAQRLSAVRVEGGSMNRVVADAGVVVFAAQPVRGRDMAVATMGDGEGS